MTRTLGPADLDDPIRPHVQHELSTIRAEQSVADALASLRTRELSEKIVYLYVTTPDGLLTGVVPTRRLLMSAPDAAIGSIMVAKVLSLPDTATVGDACECFVLHKFLALPVVDGTGHLLGTVDVRLFTDEVFDMAEKREVEDVFQLIGLRLARDEGASGWASFRARSPWLLCNIAGGVTCAFIAGRFEAFLGRALVIALFVPVVLALADGVAMQSMTVTVHALHDERLDFTFLLSSLRRELVAGSLLGGASGALVALAAWLWKGAFATALAIGASMGVAVAASCLLGVILPVALRGLRADPRIAAGPFVLAGADLVGLVLYLNLSAAILT